MILIDTYKHNQKGYRWKVGEPGEESHKLERYFQTYFKTNRGRNNRISMGCFSICSKYCLMKKGIYCFSF